MNELAEKIGAEIGKQGPISFARFMDLALYCPVYGYYEKEGDKIGRYGDYFTSVSVGALFGQLLACQFADWFEASSTDPNCRAPDAPCHAKGQSQRHSGSLVESFRIIETGAHHGNLAQDILTWLRDYKPDILNRLEYWIAEPSAHRRAVQQRTLAGFAPTVCWANEMAAVRPNQTEDGLRLPFTISFSNELLDALPFHRLGWDAQTHAWFEWGVAQENGRFQWTRLPLQMNEAEALLSHLCVPLADLVGVLPNRFTVEVCPLATQWWNNAAKIVNPGKLIAFDYGMTAQELLLPERSEGTLRAYRAHQLSADPLTRPGEQDLTAHVNFTALERAGEAAGLCTESFITQAQFLTGITARIWEKKLVFGEWTSTHSRQFQTLTHPEHLGRMFRVLVQGRQ